MTGAGVADGEAARRFGEAVPYRAAVASSVHPPKHWTVGTGRTYTDGLAEASECLGGEKKDTRFQGDAFRFLFQLRLMFSRPVVILFLFNTCVRIPLKRFTGAYSNSGY